MRRYLCYLTAVCLLFAASNSHESVIIPQQVKEIVAFIFVPIAKDKLVPNGTGFFVGVPDPRVKGNSFVYLVTAKHVLQPRKGGPFFPFVFVRLDKKDGTAQLFPWPIVTSGERRTVYFHEDNTVDLAVLPGLPKHNSLELKFIPDSAILSKEQFRSHGIAEGTDVFFTGLFRALVGEQKNYPIVRFGRVALVPSEKIDWDGAKTDLLLIESGAYGGNSGSPVFFYLGAEREPGASSTGQPELYLGGIMKGALYEGRTIKNAITSNTSSRVSNIGIAAVVPAQKLRDILFGKELTDLRSRR